MTPQLKYFKLYPDVPDLTFGTKEAACFDFRVYLKPGLKFPIWDRYNVLYTIEIEENHFTLLSGHRALIPTGIIFDIPKGYSVRVHPRSGVAIKQGLVNRNAEGIIDSDYFHEASISLVNTSGNHQKISDGERLLQCEMVPVLQYSLEETKDKPQQRTDRIGGFGSTGVN